MVMNYVQTEGIRLIWHHVRRACSCAALFVLCSKQLEGFEMEQEQLSILHVKISKLNIKIAYIYTCRIYNHQY